MRAPSSRHGILILHKPAGPTSHDIVGLVRRALGTRKVGHSGTLDPLASGVLVMGVGHGTRVLEYLPGEPKVYRASLVFGLETDTQDITGEVIEERDASAVDEEAFHTALAGFTGEQLQVPPMVSAIKIGGKKLYELARAGETVERLPRPVTFFRLEPLSFVPGRRAEAEIRAACSSGTYIRTLCHDLARTLGTGGCMTSLEREAVGPFTLEMAVTPESLSTDTPLLPLAEALAHLPRVTLSAEDAGRIVQGQPIEARGGPVGAAAEASPPCEGGARGGLLAAAEGPICLLLDSGELLAIARVQTAGDSAILAPEKVFLP